MAGDLYTLCRRQTIAVRHHVAGSSTKVLNRPAWCYGDFGAHKSAARDGWTITHLPTGTSLANCYCVFPSADEAVSAMIKIQKLRNDWAVLSGDDAAANPALKRQVSSIGQRFFGKQGNPPPWRAYPADLAGHA